jgi:DNA-binding response OmpR family regulator
MRLLAVELGNEVVAGLRSVGYAVDLAASLTEADRKLAANGYDCLILDDVLPDGFQLIHDRHIPVLMLTALPAPSSPHAHLVKPFTFADLAARVATLCRQADRSHQSILHIADLELDTSRKRVRRGGVLLSLDTKEFCVLERLTLRAGQVVSRTDLVEHCWDDDPESTVVDSVIAQLRRKLGPPIMINTVRNIGYTIENHPAA